MARWEYHKLDVFACFLIVTGVVIPAGFIEVMWAFSYKESMPRLRVSGAVCWFVLRSQRRTIRPPSYQDQAQKHTDLPCRNDERKVPV